VLREPFDSPYGRYAPVQDPQGAAFCLIQPANPSD
jgi:predicted enzyme related to lactoylglutathione lyase